jgi:hypothetical protein
MDAPERLQCFQFVARPRKAPINKLKTPPRPKRRSSSWEHLRATKPLRNQGALQVVQQIDLLPSPKRKLPRVGQKPKRDCPTPVRPPKLLSSSKPSPSAQSTFLTRFNIPSTSIDDDDGGFNDDDGGFPLVPSFEDSGMGASSPQGSADESEFDLAEAVSQIESQQASQLPAYRELLFWNAESYARLTHRCYIIQDWSPKEPVLLVRVPC